MRTRGQQRDIVRCGIFWPVSVSLTV